MTTPTGYDRPPARRGVDPRNRFGVAAPGAQRRSAAETRAAIAEEPRQDERPGRWRRLARWQRIGALILAALLLMGGGFLIGWIVMTPNTVQALRFSHGVHAGDTISAGDLEPVEVPAGTRGIVPAGELRTVVGNPARTTFPAGSLLPPRPEGFEGRQRLPGPGQTLVGLALEPGQLPAGQLRVGDTVGAVTSVSEQGGKGVSPLVLVPQAPVWAVRSHNDTLAVTLLVNAEQASKLAAYASSNSVSLIRLGTADRSGGGASG